MLKKYISATNPIAVPQYEIGKVPYLIFLVPLSYKIPLPYLLKPLIYGGHIPGYSLLDF